MGDHHTVKDIHLTVILLVNHMMAEVKVLPQVTCNRLLLLVMCSKHLPLVTCSRVHPLVVCSRLHPQVTCSSRLRLLVTCSRCHKVAILLTGVGLGGDPLPLSLERTPQVRGDTSTAEIRVTEGESHTHSATNDMTDYLPIEEAVMTGRSPLQSDLVLRRIRMVMPGKDDPKTTL